MTFIEYTKLPGIINDRLHVMFSESNMKKQNGGIGSSSSSPISPLSPGVKKPLDNSKIKKEEYVTQKSFIKNFTTIFIGDLD